MLVNLHKVVIFLLNSDQYFYRSLPTHTWVSFVCLFVLFLAVLIPRLTLPFWQTRSRGRTPRPPRVSSMHVWLSRKLRLSQRRMHRIYWIFLYIFGYTGYFCIFSDILDSSVYLCIWIFLYIFGYFLSIWFLSKSYSPFQGLGPGGLAGINTYQTMKG